MNVDVSRCSAEQVVEFRGAVTKVRGFQRRTVAEQWKVGVELRVLRALVRSMPGVFWGQVYGRFGLGLSQSSQSRFRRLAAAYPDGPPKGFTSVNKALRAARENPTVCPNAEQGIPGCKQSKRPEYAFCLPCERKREAKRLEAKQAKAERAERDRKLLDGLKTGTETACLVEQVEQLEAELAEARRDLAMLRRAVAEAAEPAEPATSGVDRRGGLILGSARKVTSKVENDWSEARPEGKSAAVTRLCLEGGFEPYLIRCRGKQPVAGWKRAKLEDFRAGENVGVVPGSVGCRVVDVDAPKGGEALSWKDLEPLFEQVGLPFFGMRSLSGRGFSPVVPDEQARRQRGVVAREAERRDPGLEGLCDRD